MLGHDDLVAEWVRRRIPAMRAKFPDGSKAIGVIDGENLLGGVVFHGYMPEYRAIEWSAAATSPAWLSLPIINEIMEYPFKQLGCNRITAAIAKKNLRAQKFHFRFGFKHEGTIRRGFGNQDAMIFGMLQSDWRKSPFNLNRVA